MTERFAGRTVLVTGAGGGIGTATSRLFASERARVICVDVDGGAAAATADGIVATGGVAVGLECDVTDADSCAAAVDAALDAGGRLDVLVNVAGVGAFVPTTDVTLDDWNRTLAVNLTGTFLMCQRALPALVESHGCIVNVASVAGVRAVPYNAAYRASKAGVVMLTKSLAVEYGGRGVRANCVCPSAVDTPFLTGFAFTDDMDLSLFARASSVLPGAMDPSVVADAIAYLASDAASMITGSTLMLDEKCDGMSQVTYDFDGKVAIVTGAGAGIGRASAVAFARAGASVVVADIDEEAGEETVAQIAGDGGTAIAVITDVASSESVQLMVARVIEAFGRLDFAHNNAGVAGDQHDVGEIPEAEWDRVHGVMLRGVYLCMKYEMPHLLAGGGAIVNTASGAGLVAYPGQAPYVSSKHGVLGLTKTAALEYGPRGVRVNAVCPGTVLTPMVQKVIEEQDLEPALVALHPIGRIGTPDEVANAVLWLCSDGASFVLGHALSVDGGYVLP